MSKLYFRYGAMNSGKSTALMQVAHNYEERNMKPFVMKPSIDTKGDNYLLSRIGIKRKVDLLITPETDLAHELKILKVDCFLVDEAQFLTKKQVDDLLIIASIRKIPVICYGLRLDFRGEGFEGSIRLLEIAHSIEELKTICRCGKKATFNVRKVNGVRVFEGSQVEIDNNPNIEYEAVCSSCYILAKIADDAFNKQKEEV